jgi:DNA-binding LacI/PurR family transcriptional regulator
MANLKDIAAMVGVSVSTVSRALHNSSRISSETKQKVFRIANSLGYTKHKEKNIVIQKWDHVGLIVPELLSQYYAQLVHLANENFAKYQLSTVIKITNFKEETMIRNIKSFSDLDVKGLLIIVDDSEEISDEVLSAVANIKLPVMFITSKYFSHLDYDSLYIDERRGITMALEYLIDKGYRRIGFIGEKQTLGRFRVYKEVMEKFNLPVEQSFVKIGRKRAEKGGYLCMKEILNQKEHPDAVFASYDHMAIGALFAVEEAGLHVPENVAILGFDDIISAQYVHKGLTTIKNPYEDMMNIAVRVLIKRIERPDSAPQQIALKPSIVIRGTTK